MTGGDWGTDREKAGFGGGVRGGKAATVLATGGCYCAKGSVPRAGRGSEADDGKSPRVRLSARLGTDQGVMVRPIR